MGPAITGNACGGLGIFVLYHIRNGWEGVKYLDGREVKRGRAWGHGGMGAWGGKEIWLLVDG